MRASWTISTVNKWYKTCWLQLRTNIFGQDSKTYRLEFLCRRTILSQGFYSHRQQLEKNTEIDVTFVRKWLKRLKSLRELRFNLWERRTNNLAKLTRTLWTKHIFVLTYRLQKSTSCLGWFDGRTRRKKSSWESVWHIFLSMHKKTWWFPSWCWDSDERFDGS